jgi:hypothetical protein
MYRSEVSVNRSLSSSGEGDAAGSDGEGLGFGAFVFPQAAIPSTKVSTKSRTRAFFMVIHLI